MFLCRVVVSDGYFLQRQFLAFSGQHSGLAVVHFTERLARYHHATAVTAKHGTRVYQLGEPSATPAAARPVS
jgi:hypothetical protein